MVQFSVDKYSYITNLGTIYGSAMEHSLIFEFITDQTAIKKFSNSLYKDFIIENAYNL